MDIKRKLEIAILSIDSIAGHTDRYPGIRKAALAKLKDEIDKCIVAIDEADQDEINEL